MGEIRGDPMGPWRDFFDDLSPVPAGHRSAGAAEGQHKDAEQHAWRQARDELFQHIMRCGVIGAEPEHQVEWFNVTMKYLGDRYHATEAVTFDELGVRQRLDRREVGVRLRSEPSDEISLGDPRFGLQPG